MNALHVSRYFLLSPPIAAAVNALDDYTAETRKSNPFGNDKYWGSGRIFNAIAKPLPAHLPNDSSRLQKSLSCARMLIGVSMQLLASLACAPMACVVGAYALCLRPKAEAQQVLAANYLPILALLHVVGVLLAWEVQGRVLPALTPRA